MGIVPFKKRLPPAQAFQATLDAARDREIADIQREMRAIGRKPCPPCSPQRARWVDLLMRYFDLVNDPDFETAFFRNVDDTYRRAIEASKDQTDE